MLIPMRLRDHVREHGIKCGREVLNPAGRKDRVLATYAEDSGELIVRGYL